MKILHLCNNYVSSLVHKKLICALASEEDVRQSVFVPVRTSDYDSIGKDPIDGVDIYYSKCYPRLLKFFPLLKTLSVFFAILRSPVVIKSEDFLIAHTLWSDGVPAFFLSLIFRKPYFVFVRNTDVNIFLRYLFYYRWLMRLVATNATRVYFVSPAYMERCLSSHSAVFGDADCEVCTNGIDEYWIKNTAPPSDLTKTEVLFVGRFDKNKNIPTVLAAVQYARELDPRLTLRLVGGELGAIYSLLGVSSLPSWVRVDQPVKDMELLAAMYSKALVLLVPSIHETFGLVYIEALSQGCPCLFTKSEAVDGLFEESAVFAGFSALDAQGFSKAILNIVNGEGAEELSTLQHEVKGGFSWSDRAKKILRATQDFN